MSNATNATDLGQWLSFDDFTKSYPNFTNNQIEWIYRNRQANGFGAVFRKIGRKKYLHVGIFSECLHE